jgi:hypothetical protein
MPETNAQQLARLKKELTRLIVERNAARLAGRDAITIGEITKDIADSRKVINMLETIIQEGHP